MNGLHLNIINANYYQVNKYPLLAKSAIISSLPVLFYSACIVFITTICLPACGYAQRVSRPGADTSAAKITPGSLKASYQIISVPGGGFGYEIWVDGKRKIIQRTIPSKQGRSGFVSKTEAARVAEIVVQKMEQGQTLPTVTLEELKTLHITLN